jgi:hypothetical protein
MANNVVIWCTFREGQMYRAVQTAMAVHKPDVVFVLGEFLIKFGNLNHIETSSGSWLSFGESISSCLHVHFLFKNCGF